jgi:poly(3-hydroxybutyrate) depolymerase
MRFTLRLLAGLCVLLTAAHVSQAQPTRPLPGTARIDEVTVSGISSGAAMALQFAVAHSATVAGVAAIAGPSWGCARGLVSTAINDCMCGRQALPSALPLARELAERGAIDPLRNGRPQALSRGFIFHSPLDATVVASTGEASAAFLASFIGTPPSVDRGNAADGSSRAGHGILSPAGTDRCEATAQDRSYVRQCGQDDNARDLFHALFPGVAQDPAKRLTQVSAADLQAFDQRPFIQAVTRSREYIAPDSLAFFFYPTRSERRQGLDMAATGYVHVPPSCRQAGARCGLHIAFHGCKQQVREFALTTGYIPWAEQHRQIILFPAIDQGASPVSEACSAGAINKVVDTAWYQPNPNGCWDWWGYLDGVDRTRHLTRKGLQMRVIEQMVRAITGR